jgi:molecular chaperone DnaK (HSP70)
MQILGIDLGTTNTVVADADGVRSIGGHHMMPSVVGFAPQAVVVGDLAKQRRPIDPKNTVVSSKRLMGSDTSASTVAEFSSRYAMDVVASPQGPAFVTRGGTHTAEQIAAFMLEAAVVDAGVDPTNVMAVVTVPAAFRPEQRDATRRAAQRAGLTQVVLVDEPVAVAIAHEGVVGSRITAVYDIGGGTFDFAVVERTEKRARILAHGGDLFLGGDDFDYALACVLADQLLTAIGWDVRQNVSTFDRLVTQCERVKIALSVHAGVDLDLLSIEPALAQMTTMTTMHIPREVLTAACMSLARRTFVTCDEVLREAGVSARELQGVFLAGGTTLVPFVEDLIGKYFQQQPSYEVPPLHVIALGAYRTAAAAFSI